MSEISIREMREDDLPGVLELLERGLGPGPVPRTEAYWRWKHLDNPFGRSPCLLAEAGRRIVGLRAFLRWSWVSGERRIESVRAVDTVTDPALRGRGLFTRLTTELVAAVQAEGAAFVFNTPNASSRPGYLKMGWRPVGRVPILIRIPRPLRLLRSFLRGPSPTVPPGFDPPPVAELLAAVRRNQLALPQAGGSGDTRLRTPHSLEYLTWRYAEATGLDYRCLWQDSPGGGAAVVVRLRERRGLREATVCELLIGEDPRDIDLAAALLRRLAACGADYLAATAARETPERRALRRAGFLPPARLGPILTVRSLQTPVGSPDPSSAASWRYAIGDLELF